MSTAATIEKVCVECDTPFTVECKRARKVTCSPQCAHERKKRASRNHAARIYTTASKSIPERSCVRCAETFQPYRDDSLYCTRLCQRRARQQRLVDEKPAQCCHSCGTLVAGSQPGLRVCDACRKDRRPSREAQLERERQRRFRTYGITEAEYDAMLASQGGCCAICRTDTPTVKGWAIDHCHESGMVRGILCARCNSAIGLLGEDPQAIARAAEYVSRHLQIRLVS